MWRVDKEMLEKGINENEVLKKDGCYDCTINKFMHFKSDKSEAEAIKIFLENDKKEIFTLNLFFKKSTGEEIDFNLKHLNQLEYLLKINHNDIEWEQEEDNYKNIRLVSPNFKNKRIGAIVEVEDKKEDEKTKYDYKLKCFYEIENKRTSFEIKKGKDAETYYYYLDKFGQNENTDVNVTEIFGEQKILNDDDGFPF